jgi:tetratricopeptide (TPR) repeat protein
MGEVKTDNEAISNLDDAIRLDPGSNGASTGWVYAGSAYVGRAQLRYLIKGDLVGTESDLKAAILTGAPIMRADAHFYYGLLSARRGEWKSAVEHFDQAWTLRPQMVELYVYSKEAWLLATCPDAQVRDASKAEALALKAISSDADNAGAYEALAAAHARAGRFDDAVGAQNKAIQTYVRTHGNKDSSEVRDLREELSTLQRHEPLTAGPETWWYSPLRDGKRD